MKKNIFLFLGLVLLLGITYIVHERGGELNEKAHLEKHQLFNPEKLGEILVFSNGVATLERTETGFVTTNQKIKVDQRKFDSAMEILAPIQAKRFLVNEELEDLQFNLAFPHLNYKFSFKFERGEVEYLIGEKLQFSQDFYMRVKWRYDGEEEVVKTVIATDVSPTEGVYSQETFHLSDRKYVRLLSLVFLDEEFFADTRLIPNLDSNSLLSLTLENMHNRAFEIDFQKNEVTPKPFDPLISNLNEIQSLKTLLVNLSGDRLISEFEKAELGDIIATMKINLQDQKPVELKLYQNYKSHGEMVATSSLVTGLFPIKPAEANVFLRGHQFYWDRTPKIEWENLRLQNLDESMVVFKSLPVEIKDSWALFFDRPADMISDSGPMDKNKILTLRSGDDILYLTSHESEVQLSFEKKKVVYHYFYNGTLPFVVDPARLKAIP